MSSLNIDYTSREEFFSLLNKLCEEYYNDISTISDEKYDSLKELYEKTFREEYTKVGATPNQCKETLPKYMGSLNKIKDEKSLNNWKKKFKGPFLITDKIDGISSLQYGKKLYTRGDGLVGTNISHLLPLLKNFPGDSRGVFIRSEIVMPKSKFVKYSGEMANARNMVSGLIGRKTSLDKNVVKDLLLLSYEWDSNKLIAPSHQLQKLESNDYNIPPNKLVSSEELTIEYLTTLFKKRKEEADYDIDGLVIFDDNPYSPVEGENPKNGIAFKIEGKGYITTVDYVEWNVSKNGLLKPRVKIVPVQLPDSLITWCTGFNAKFIIDNKICKGAKLEITRSGDVIPFIKNVLEEGETPQMPDEEWEWSKKKYMVEESELKKYNKLKDDLTYEIHDGKKYWTWVENSEVDICVVNEGDELKIQKLHSFFKHMDAKFMGKSTVNKLYEGGYKSLYDIFNLEKEDVTELEGFKEKGAIRVIESIKGCIKDVSLSKLSGATGIMGTGIGERKFQLVLDEYPNILEMDLPLGELKKIIESVKGFKTLSIHFASKLPLLKKFLKDHPQITIKKESSDENDSERDDEDTPKDYFNGKTVVFTGFRTKEGEELIKKCGGKVTTSVSGKTNLLVVSHRYSGNSKEIKADQLGIEVITGEEFIEKYM